MADPITTIGLCAGVGWLDEAVGTGLRHFGLQHRVAAYCEWEAYAQAVLLARMEESSLEPAPVWGGDLGAFDGLPFRGAVDGIVAGFPCQPWSNAGQRKGTADDRWLWPAIVRVIAEVGPWFVFLENVSALITGGGLEHVLSDLAEMGFDAEWCCLTAESVGASHRRERVFILAYSEHAITSRFRRQRWARATEAVQRGGSSYSVADAECPVTRAGNDEGSPAGKRRNRPAIDGDAVAVSGSDGGRISQPRRRSRRGTAAGGTGAELGNAPRHDEQRDSVPAVHRERESPGGPSGDLGNATSESAQGRRGEHACQRILGSAGGGLFAPGPGADWSGIPEALWPATERGVRLLVDGSPVVLDASRADQLRCSGNGVVALQGSVAFVELVRRAGLRG